MVNKKLENKEKWKLEGLTLESGPDNRQIKSVSEDVKIVFYSGKVDDFKYENFDFELGNTKSLTLTDFLHQKQ